MARHIVVNAGAIVPGDQIEMAGFRGYGLERWWAPVTEVTHRVATGPGRQDLIEWYPYTGVGTANGYGFTRNSNDRVLIKVDD